MKVMKKVFLFFVILTLGACSWGKVDDEVNEELTSSEQKEQWILGPGDCRINNWSWNNSIATVGSVMVQFDFITNVKGDFSFTYIINDNEGELEVKLDDKLAYKTDDENIGSWTPIKIGPVNSGIRITFYGRFCSVKDIVIKPN